MGKASKLKRTRRQAIAQQNILPKLRGCLLVLGWELLESDDTGLWMRGEQTYPDTFDGVVAALLLDAPAVKASATTC